MTRLDQPEVTELQHEFHRIRVLSPLEREVAIRALERTDAALAETLTGLLHAHASTYSVLDADVRAALPAESTDLFLEVLPPSIGSYRVLRELGRGGMAVVLLGEREHPKRQVALKCLRRGQSTEMERQRFTLEQELLLRLRHPGIVSIYEMGTVHLLGLASGERCPWFAMELVDGERLDAWSTKSKPSLIDRKRVLREIIAAVAHAHARGVVHADLKPSNVLIDAEGHVRVLDFGIGCLAVDPPATGGVAFGTIAYSSPETFLTGRDELSRRSDVYSLGILGYEILTGECASVRGALGLTMTARVGGTQRPPLRRVNAHCSREYEAILQKAASEDPRQRYRDATELEEDLARADEGLPVRAIPTSTAYSCSCFSRRNRALVGVVTTAMLALVSATVFTMIANHRTTLSEQIARDESRSALREASRAKNTLRFITGLLATSSPTELGREVTVRDAIDEAATRVDAELAGDPYAAAQVHLTLAQTYRAIAAFDAAEQHFARATEFLADSALLREDEVDLARGIEREAAAGRAATRLARGDLTESNRILDTVLSSKRSAERPDSAWFLAVETKAQIALAQQQPLLAIPLLRNALLKARAIDDPATIARFQAGLGAALIAAGKIEEAAAELEPLVEILRGAYGNAYPSVGVALHNLASIRRREGNPQEAARLLGEALEVYGRAYGTAHPRIAETYNSLGTALRQANQTRAAVEQYMLAMKPEHAVGSIRRAMFAQNLASAQGELGETENALASFDLALALLGADPKLQSNIASVYWNRSCLLKAVGRNDDAAVDWRLCLAIRELEGGERAMSLIGPLADLAMHEATSGTLEKARVYAARALALEANGARISPETSARLKRLLDDSAVPSAPVNKLD